MIPVLNDSHRFQVLNWHRKARKTTLAINQLIRWAASVPAVFWYVGPSYGNAKRVVWDDPQMFAKHIPDWNEPDSNFIKKKETELRVDFKQSGGQLYVFGSDRPDLMRGPNPMGVVLDEYSVQRPEVWNDVIQPIMRANADAWCWFLFTPQGKNHAFDVYQFGQRGDSEWKSWKLPVTESGIYAPDQIENAKRDMPDHTFNQELMCEFIEGEGSVFRGVRDVAKAQPAEPALNHMYVMGVDVAKVQDYTVITVYDRMTNSQVYQDRFQTLEWPFQKSRIKSVSDHYNRAVVYMDATGLGDPLVDDLVRSGVPVEPYKFTNESKKELVEKLSIFIDQRRIRILNMPDTLFEFDNFSYEMSSTGKITYGARDGFHDDIVMAHALAVWGLQAPVIAEKRPQVPLIRQEYQSRIKANYGTDDDSDYEAI